MSFFFSRTSEIISRSLLDLLSGEAQPQQAIRQIISEIEGGLAGVSRSVDTATRNEQRIAAELVEHKGQVTFWMARARESLSTGHEQEARAALIRKKELEDLIAGLEQEHVAAQATRDQLTTTLRAVEARLAEARRLQAQLDEGQAVTNLATVATGPSGSPETVGKVRAEEVDDELALLKREMNLP